MADMKAKKIYKIVIFRGKDKKKTVPISKIWCAYGHLYYFDEHTNHLLTKIKENKELMAFDFQDKLDNIFFDDQEKNNIALLTKGQKVNVKNEFSCLYSI
ncbi:hypothetical protein RF11_14660 [Thelohanellus kitauei]|uniref:Uncharacterized protein n=1 Tax=Thelohanellus kitauei TaxID=669202 RepID=A0A0C2IFC0_THEKT|nr:hypothetical protein RF11_14660 [Thelohanellus kitauei]